MGIVKHIFRKLAITAVASAAVIAAGVTAYAAEEVSINEENFPDAVFREYVLDNCDKDDSGMLSESEIAESINFDLRASRIVSLEGIEHFTELKTLDCRENALTTLDVSGFVSLTELKCSDNDLTNLDISGCTALTSLEYYGNPLVSIDASRCYSLSDAELASIPDELETLDVSYCISFEGLTCSARSLRTLNVEGCSALVHLDCNNNELTSLNVSGCHKLTNLLCQYNAITKLDVSDCFMLNSLLCNNNAIEKLDVSNCTFLTMLNCSNNALTSLDLSNNKDLSTFSCLDNAYTMYTNSLDILEENGFDISKASDWQGAEYDAETNTLSCTYGTVKYSYDVSSQIYGGQTATFTLNLDIPESGETGETDDPEDPDVPDEPVETDELPINETNFPDAVFRQYILDECDKDGNGYLSNEEISDTTSIDLYRSDAVSLEGIKYFTALQRLMCFDNKLTELDLSGCTSLEHLACTRNRLTSLDVSDCTALTELSCDNNKLTELDVSGLTMLEYIRCSGNELSSLDVSDCTALTDLECDNNKLTELDLSKNTALTYLDCSDNKLTSLDVSNNSALKNLYCSKNKLTELDVAANTALTRLDISKNRIADIDVSNNPLLQRLTCDYNDLTELDLSANTALTELYCNSNFLTALDLSENAALTELECSSNHLTSLRVNENTKVWCKRNEYTLTTESLDELTEYGFEPTKASNWQGAEYDEETNSLVNITSDIVTYDYDAGADEPITFTLKLDIDKPVEEDPDIPDVPVEPTEPDVPVIKLTTGDDSITVSWEDTGADLYRIRRNDGSGWVNYKDVTATSYTDTAVESGTQYRYAVYACVDGVWSGASNIVSGTIVTTTEGFTVTATANGVLIEWDETEGAELYRIRRNDGSGWTNYKDLTETTYTDTDAAAGGKYYYAVYAKVDGTWSKVTEIVSIALKPEAPTGMSATETDGAVSLEWDAVAGATYRIRRNDGSGWVNYKDLSENAYVDTDVTAGSSYKYAVYACVNGMWSGASAIVSVSVS